MSMFDELRQRGLQDFPRESGQYGDSLMAIDNLRTVYTMSRTIAALLADAQHLRGDDDEHADYLEQCAREASDLLLSVCEDAVRAMPNTARDNQLKAD